MARFRIVSLMVLVALAALNAAAIRAVLGRSDRFNELWAMGALPMANALVVGMLIGYRHRQSRGIRFVYGFESFGVTALTLYVAGMWLYPDMTGMHFRLFIEPHGVSLVTINVVIFDCIPLAMVGLTQFAFALVGGFLFHNLVIR